MQTLTDAALLDLAARALGDALAGQDSERTLARVLRGAQLGQPQRAQLAAWVLGSSVLRRRLAYLCSQAGVEPTAEALVLAYRVRELGEASEDDERARRLSALEPEWPTDPVEQLAVRASLPDWIAQLWLCELEAPLALAEACNRPGPVTLRANALKASRDEVQRTLAAEGIATEAAKHAPFALHVLGRANLWGSSAWRGGLFEVQDEGSQLIAEACRARPGESWLDLCAGSGGKTLALAAAMENRGRIVACDIDPARLHNLRARVERAGVRCVEVRLLEPGHEVEALGAQHFDGVLVDAPCSELGILRRHPDSRWRITPASIEHLPLLQQRLIELGREHLTPGGRFVYATCTLRRAENQMHNLGCAMGLKERTLRPDREGTDGFYIAAAE